MALLAEKRFEEIGFGDISARAGLSLATAASEFGSTLAILAAHMKELDRKVLAGADADMAEEPPRERLFDVLMRRIEAMAPYREATRSLMNSASRNPGLAFALNGLAVRSQTWMLTAANIDAAGPRGMIRAQGLAMLFASVLRTWVDDEDEGHARRWRRSIARSRAASAGPACSTISAASSPATAARAGAAATRKKKSRRRRNFRSARPRESGDPEPRTGFPLRGNERRA